MYEKQRFTKLTKKELQAEQKKLQAKIKSTGTDYEDIYDDDISCSDDNWDEDFVPEMPATGTLSKRKLSIFFSKTTVPKKIKSEGNESADEDDDDAVEINKKTIKKIQKNKKHQKTPKKIQQKRSHSSDNGSSDVQEDSSSDDDNASKKVKSFRYGKVAFYKVYKGPRR